MSSTPTEWKTIRVPAESYYKLSELSGFLTIIFGNQVALSAVATWAINEYYLRRYPTLLTIVTDTEKLKKARIEIKKTTKDFANMTGFNIFSEALKQFQLEEDRERDG